MAIERELTSEIAAAMLMAKEDSDEAREKKKQVLAQVHETLVDLSRKCRPRNRRNLWSIPHESGE